MAARWSPSSTGPAAGATKQILEEHAFALELDAAEVPVIPPLVLDAAPIDAPADVRLRGKPPTLACNRHRSETATAFSVSRRCAGREPETRRPGHLAPDRPLHRPAAQRRAAPAFRLSTRDGPRGKMAATRCSACSTASFVAEEQRAAWAQHRRPRPEGCRTGLLPTMARRGCCACHGDCHLGNVLWRDGGPARGLISTTLCMGPAVQDLWMLVSGRRGHDGGVSWPSCSRATRSSSISTARELRLIEPPAHTSHGPAQCLAGRPLDRPGLPAGLSVLRHGRLLVTADHTDARNRSRPWEGG
jgi:hypothetical protein